MGSQQSKRTGGTDINHCKLKVMGGPDPNSNGNCTQNYQYFPDNPFREDFDTPFWDEVTRIQEVEKKSVTDSIMAARIDALDKKAKEVNKNIIVFLFYDIYDSYYNAANEEKKLERMTSFVKEFTQIIHQILKNDAKDKPQDGIYCDSIDISDTIDMTVVHLAAARNLTSVIESVLSIHPDQFYTPTSCGKAKQQLPVELALENYHDDAAAFLIKKAKHKQGICSLFKWDDSNDRKEVIDLNDLIKHGNMKKTIVEILNSFINPEYLPQPDPPKELKLKGDYKLPDVLPQTYHLGFRILDGDPKGRPANHPLFDHRSHSALYNIAHCSYSNELIRHPLIRKLAQRKWDIYGKKVLAKWIILHVIYLLCMTIAFFLKQSNGNRAKYEDDLDYTRAAFEMATLALACFYFIIEIMEMVNEGKNYLTIPNTADLLGIALVLSLAPVKFLAVDHEAKNPSEIEWYVASVTFLVNVFRLFKWFPVISYVGVHSILIKRLLFKDIPKFLIVYSVIAAAFLGSIELALRAVHDGFSMAGTNSWGIVLAEVRALSETNGFDDKYIGKYRLGVIFLITLNMMSCILILANILIAHLSNAYTEAFGQAKVQCDIDRTYLVTRYENSWFKALDLRVKHYEDAVFIEDITNFEKIRTAWNTKE